MLMFAGLKGKFPDGVYDVVFGEFTGEQDMKQLISSRQKELLYCLTTEEVSVDDYVKNKLGDVLEGKQCLILLENVQDERIIQEFRFAGFNGALLVTGPQDVWPTAPSPLSVTPQHFLDALAPGKPSLAQNIVERYKKRMLKQVGTHPCRLLGMIHHNASTMNERKCQDRILRSGQPSCSNYSGGKHSICHWPSAITSIIVGCSSNSTIHACFIMVPPCADAACPCCSQEDTL